MLAPANKIVTILAEMEIQLRKRNNTVVAERVRALRQQWRTRYEAICAGSAASKSEARQTQPSNKLTGRKVNRYIVVQVFQLLGKGHNKTKIAKALKISLGVVQKLAAGTYPITDPDAKEAWWETFGGQSRDGNAFTVRNTADQAHVRLDPLLMAGSALKADSTGRGKLGAK